MVVAMLMRMTTMTMMACSTCMTFVPILLVGSVLRMQISIQMGVMIRKVTKTMIMTGFSMWTIPALMVELVGVQRCTLIGTVMGASTLMKTMMTITTEHWTRSTFVPKDSHRG